MRNLLHQVWIPLVLLVASAAVARAQSDQQSTQQGQQQNQQQGQQAEQSSDQSAQPIPAYHSPLANLGSAGSKAQDENTPDLKPDTRPLSGAQGVSFGIPYTEHSYWEPAFMAYSTFDSNPLGLTSGWTAYTSLLGTVDVHRTSPRNDLLLDYAGGGTISSDPNMGNAVLQQVEFGDTVSMRRADLSFFDSASYIPEASYGYGELGGLSLPGTGFLGLANTLVPDQSILGARQQRIANSFITQVNAQLTPRSSATFLGGYGLLHFLGSGYIDSHEPMFQAGYNYQASRRNTIAAFYNFTDYQYSELSESIWDNRMDVSYARRVTGRIAFQVAAGPEVILFQQSASGTGGGVGVGLKPGSQVSWNLSSSFAFALQRGQLALSYTHGADAGSGVLVGASQDLVSGSVSRAVSRTLDGSLQFGYARSKGLNNNSSGLYDYWFAGAGLNRPLGRSLSLVLNYQFQRETSNSALCIGNSCGSFVRNTISVGLNYHIRPLAF